MDELSKKLLARTLAMQSSNLEEKTSLNSDKKEKASKNKGKSDFFTGKDCRICVHFFITWEKNCPYGCKAYGFKSFNLPSITVKSSSGENCNFFKQRS